jgi:thiamine pyrophosphokinase
MEQSSRNVICNLHVFETDLFFPTVLVILNTPLEPRALRRAWQASHSLRVCADGASNRLRAAAGCSDLVPDLICGDWDSITRETEEHFSKLNVEFVKNPLDQDSTDLMKCLVQVAKRMGESVSKTRVIVYGAFGGRFDQEMQNFNTMYSQPWCSMFKQMTLLADDCIACVIPEGKNILRVSCPYEGPNCGLVPLGGRVRSLTTKGLHWDVSEWESNFGGKISSSNRVEYFSKESCARLVDVEVDVSDPIVWTASLPPVPVVALCVMGVCGAGKSTTAELIGAKLFDLAAVKDGDEFHSAANKAKMAGGTPLDDTDHAPWLSSIADWIGNRASMGLSAVVSCSALKRKYRDLLRETVRSFSPQTELRFAFLSADKETLLERLTERARTTSHYMKPGLLDSQLSTLEVPSEDEKILQVDVTHTNPVNVAAMILTEMVKY